jgi:plasmid stabilization system protein ParE
MSFELIWQAPALQDLRDIKAYHAQTSPDYAKRITEQILHIAERLRDMPNIGHIIPQHPPA